MSSWTTTCQEDDPVSLCLRIFSQELLEIGQLQSSQKKMAMCQWILYEMNSFLHILNLLLLCYAMNVSNVLCAAIVIVSCWWCVVLWMGGCDGLGVNLGRVVLWWSCCGEYIEMHWNDSLDLEEWQLRTDRSVLFCVHRIWFDDRLVSLWKWCMGWVGFICVMLSNECDESCMMRRWTRSESLKECSCQHEPRYRHCCYLLEQQIANVETCCGYRSKFQWSMSIQFDGARFPPNVIDILVQYTIHDRVR